MSHQAEVLLKQPGQGGLEVDDCSPTLLPDSFEASAPWPRPLKPPQVASELGVLEAGINEGRPLSKTRLEFEESEKAARREGRL